jgi:chromosome segregation ATPase
MFGGKARKKNSRQRNGGWLVNRRLEQNAARLRAARAKLALAEEQLSALEDEASSQELRAIVSETPDSGFEYRRASAHAAAMRRHRDDLRREVADLASRQDQLLDRLSAPRGNGGV